ncbi:MAG: hypothetical protein CMH60_07755 [Myxococcales bacterium]|nr:hypothetical protein [Myxococcales bacterium]
MSDENKNNSEANDFGRRSDDQEGVTSEGPIKMDLPDLERDASGIPTFIFKDHLPDEDRPSADKKALEVVLLWHEAVMSVGHYIEPRLITVGDGKKNDFRIAAEKLPLEHFPLLDMKDGSFVVKWSEEMAMEVRAEDGEIITGDALIDAKKVTSEQREGLDGKIYKEFTYRVGLNDRVAVQIDQLTFVLQYVAPARFPKAALMKTLDLYFTKVLSISFVGHLFVLLALLLTPIDPSDLEEDLFKNPNRFAKLILKEPEKAPEPKKKFELSGSKGGGKHKDEEGKFGKPEENKQDALASTAGAPKVDPNKREKDRKIALDSGIFAALKGGEGGAASNIFGPGGLGTGINNALGGLRGTAMGDAGGAGGLGSRGTGPGGGGNSLGIGGLGSGTGRGTGGMGDIDLGGRGKGKYAVIPGRTITKGCLSRAVVGRVIGRVNNQIRYCYEKELPRNPNLEGKIACQFVIGPTGSVISARIGESTMGDANVENCIMKVVKRLKFPPCAGGGTVDVTYPWIFKSGG